MLLAKRDRRRQQFPERAPRLTISEGSPVYGSRRFRRGEVRFYFRDKNHDWATKVAYFFGSRNHARRIGEARYAPEPHGSEFVSLLYLVVNTKHCHAETLRNSSLASSSTAMPNVPWEYESLGQGLTSPTACA